MIQMYHDFYSPNALFDLLYLPLFSPVFFAPSKNCAHKEHISIFKEKGSTSAKSKPLGLSNYFLGIHLEKHVPVCMRLNWYIYKISTCICTYFHTWRCCYQNLSRYSYTITLLTNIHPGAVYIYTQQLYNFIK